MRGRLGRRGAKIDQKRCAVRRFVAVGGAPFARQDGPQGLQSGFFCGVYTAEAAETVH
ncbi:hypothetical protein HMPREF0262_03016 [Clostridium sp. ATCC 29733]|nr:hypothetical protein HMPREF0262_03016 [Clostridium sp. ATCC 29733]